MVEHKNIMTVLVGFTALVHFGVGLVTTIGDPIVFNMFVMLNGLGYAALLIGLYYTPSLEQFETAFRNTLIAFTGITFVAYFLSFSIEDALTNPVGMITKLDELAIIFFELRYLTSPSEKASSEA